MSMNRNQERRRWAMCFGGLGVLVAAGALVGSPRVAEAQQTGRAPGAAEFGRACGRCHPNGDEDTGPDLHNKNKSVADMTRIIREGSGKMRPVGPAKLSDANLAKVMLFLRGIHAVR